MTKEERQQKENLAAMRKAQEDSFKQNARSEALRVAQSGRPIISPLGQEPEKYDLLKEAEKIYQWLIKVLKA